MHRQWPVLIPSLGRFHSSQIHDLALASGDFSCPGCHGQFTVSKNGRSRKQNLATSCSHLDVSDQIERERDQPTKLQGADELSMSTTAWRWVSDSTPEIRKTPDGDSGISSSTPANMLCILKSIMLST